MASHRDGPDPLSSAGNEDDEDKRDSLLFVATAAILALCGVINVFLGNKLLAMGMMLVLAPASLWRAGQLYPDDS